MRRGFIGRAQRRAGAALELLERAQSIRPGPDLRDEYVRCLELADLRPVCSLVSPDDATLARIIPPWAIQSWPGDEESPDERRESRRYQLEAGFVALRGTTGCGLLVPDKGHPVEFDTQSG